MSNSFAVSIEPKRVQLLNHTNGALTVTVSNDLNFAHLSFATPYEAWKWAENLAAELSEQMTASAEVVK